MTESKKPRRARADSKTSAVAAMQASNRKIVPPSDLALDKEERTIFREVIAEFPKVELTDHQVRIAALLAKEIKACADAQKMLKQEGSVITNSRGNAVLNPRVRVAQQHTASILSMRRSLALHARAKEGGDNRLIARRRQIHRENEQGVDDTEGLIPRGPLN